MNAASSDSDSTQTARWRRVAVAVAVIAGTLFVAAWWLAPIVTEVAKGVDDGPDCDPTSVVPISDIGPDDPRFDEIQAFIAETEAELGDDAQLALEESFVAECAP